MPPIKDSSYVVIYEDEKGTIDYFQYANKASTLEALNAHGTRVKCLVRGEVVKFSQQMVIDEPPPAPRRPRRTKAEMAALPVSGPPIGDNKVLIPRPKHVGWPKGKKRGPRKTTEARAQA